MPTKNEILLKFQKDLQELNASFEAGLARIEKARMWRPVPPLPRSAMSVLLGL